MFQPWGKKEGGNLYWGIDGVATFGFDAQREARPYEERCITITPKVSDKMTAAVSKIEAKKVCFSSFGDEMRCWLFMYLSLQLYPYS
jgi:hypothetical protein